MLLVVFGAGASFDSVAMIAPGHHENADARPPLANQLFDIPTRPSFRTIHDRFSQAAPLFHALLPRAGGTGVEQVLEEFAREAKSNERRAKQLTALRYYIRDALRDCDDRWTRAYATKLNHIALLEEIERTTTPEEPVLLVTFNYDTVIETALHFHGHQIESLDAYIDHPRFKLFKLHGSTTWVRDSGREEPFGAALDAAGLANLLIENGGSDAANGKIYYENDTPFRHRLLLPALAVPIAGKSDFECPPLHRAKLGELIPRVRRILCIGWRGQESHFLQMLKVGLKGAVLLRAVADSVQNAQTTLDTILRARVAATSAEAHGGFSSAALRSGARSARVLRCDLVAQGLLANAVWSQ